MKAAWLARYWSLVVVACVRLLFLAAFSANTGGDSIISHGMMMRGESNLVIPPGYAFLIGLPFRLLFDTATLEANQATFSFTVITLQHLIAFGTLILLHRLVRPLFGGAAAHIVTLLVGLHWGLLAATSQISPEWLQASLIFATAFFAVAASRAVTVRAQLLGYAAAAFLFAWAYLAKFNALYFALLFAALLAVVDRTSIRRRLQSAAAIVAVFMAVTWGFKIFFHEPRAGTYALTHDRAWVLLFKSAYFCAPLSPESGPHTKRLLLLNTLLPWDNKNVGSIPNIRAVAPDVEEYRKKYLYILDANDAVLDELLARTELRKDFSYFTAFSPTTYYLGLAEGDQLGVEVFKECVRANTQRYATHVAAWSFSRLLALDTIDPFPLSVAQGFAKAGENGWYWFDGTRLKRNGTDPFDNPVGYFVWAPAIPLFAALRAAWVAVPNWLVTIVCLAGFAAAAVRRRDAADWVVVACGVLAFGFIVASNAVLDFRWYKELFAILPMIALIFTVALQQAGRAAVAGVARIAAAAGPFGEPPAGTPAAAPQPPALAAAVVVPTPVWHAPTPRGGTPPRALVTGSAGLIGSECTRLLCEQGWRVVGVDNDMRREFFGQQGSTRGVVRELRDTFSTYEHRDLDIRDRAAIRDLFEGVRPDLVIHAAAQPSHDKAASIPYDDFDVNAVGTLNLLVAARDFTRDAPFCFTSTNKVYGDRPNFLPLVEHAKRFDYADGRDGIDETLSIDACLHSLFGASKVAADVLCQEFGRYFQMPIGVFRAGCLTGPQHAAVELHGYLAYIVACALQGRPYTIFGYKGKQVRDQIHCRDVAHLFVEFHGNPRCGEVYNLGGGRANSLSILETIDVLAEFGCTLQHSYKDANRIGDHICYISDLTKVKAHFPGWQIEWDIRRIVAEMVERQRLLLAPPARVQETS